MTSFILLNTDQTPLKWPLTPGDLKAAYPNVSFPSDIPAEGFPDFNIYPFLTTAIPAYDAATEKVDEVTPAQIDGTWTQQWSIVALTPEEKNEADERQATSVRAQRNSLLAACDWTQLPDAPVDHETWATYRQNLRDVTAQAGFPWDVVWPTPPA